MTVHFAGETKMSDDGRAVIESLESQLSFKEHLDREQWILRKKLASSIMSTFLWINGTVLLLIVGMYVADCIFLSNGVIKSSERVIGANVIMSIVGATTIQLGAIAASLSRWLFPKV